MKKSRGPSDYKLYLQEIVLHIQIIEEYTKGMTLDQFIHDRKTIDAVNTNLRNIGEAMNVLSKIPKIKSILSISCSLAGHSKFTPFSFA